MAEFIAGSGTPGSTSYSFIGVTEMDVSKVLVFCGNTQSGIGETGAFRLEVQQVFNYFSYDGFGTQEYTLDPPLKVRAGDELVIFPAGGNVETYASIVLYGHAPNEEKITIR